MRVESAAKFLVGHNSSSSDVTTTKLSTHVAPDLDVVLRKNGAKIFRGERSAVKNASGQIVGSYFKMQQRNLEARRSSIACYVTSKTAVASRLVRGLLWSEGSASQLPIR